MVVAHLRRLLGARHTLWLGTFTVVVISLFAWASARRGEEKSTATGTSSWWTDILPAKNSPALDELTRVPDPQTEAHAQVWGNYKWYSDTKLRALAACMARGDCHKNAHKVSCGEARRAGHAGHAGHVGRRVEV